MAGINIEQEMAGIKIKGEKAVLRDYFAGSCSNVAGVDLYCIVSCFENTVPSSNVLVSQAQYDARKVS